MRPNLQLITRYELSVDLDVVRVFICIILCIEKRVGSRGFSIYEERDSLDR